MPDTSDDTKQREAVLRSMCYLPGSWTPDTPGKLNVETSDDTSTVYRLADDGLGCYGLMAGDICHVSTDVEPQYGCWVVVSRQDRVFIRLFELTPEKSKVHRPEIFVQQGDIIIGTVIWCERFF